MQYALLIYRQPGAAESRRTNPLPARPGSST
jgi:hypothetical protein